MEFIADRLDVPAAIGVQSCRSAPAESIATQSDALLLNAQIRATRVGGGAVDTIGDYEVAKGAAAAGVLQFEGMHRLAPDNEDALFMLTRGWSA